MQNVPQRDGKFAERQKTPQQQSHRAMQGKMLLFFKKRLDVNKH